MTNRSLALVGMMMALMSGGAPDAWPGAAGEPAGSDALQVPVADAQHEVESGVILAGTLRLDALDQLESSDTLIVDLRTAREDVAALAAAAERRGIEYRNVPVDGAAFSGAELDAVAEALAEAGARTVILSCATGNRAGMIWGAMALRRGVPLDVVMEDLDSVITRQPVRDALAAYAETLARTHVQSDIRD
jgi:protein tyrosine phosphatase (PTP) superfamily phosphohydrolase (DUF442 family)